MLATDLLNAHLRDKDISQRQFAAETGIPKTTIGDICSGKAAAIGVDTARKLAPLLGRSVAALLEIEDEAGQVPSASDAFAAESAARGAAIIASIDSGVIMIPHRLIIASAKNPRKSFDAEALAELAESIFENDVLQNLVVRRMEASGDGNGFTTLVSSGEPLYEIVAGERRYRAVDLLIDSGRLPKDFAVPCRIINTDDDQHRALALLENLQRVDLSPMEEAEAFKTLMELSWSTAQIAERIHKTQRFVQQRLALVTRLGDEARAALSEGRITIDIARALSTTTPQVQKHILKKIDAGYGRYATAADVRRHLTSNTVPVTKAIFPRDRYQGEIREDDLGNEYFADIEAFKELQKAAVEELAAAKRADGWSWVAVSSYHQTYGYEKETSTDKTKAGVVIVFDYRHEVEVIEGLVRNADFIDDNEEDDLLAEDEETSAEAADLAAAGAAARKKREEKEQAKRERQRVECEALEKELAEAVLNDPKLALRMLVDQACSNWDVPDGFEHQPWSKIAEMTERQLGLHVAPVIAVDISLSAYDGVSLALQALAASVGITLPKYLRLEKPPKEKPAASGPTA